MGNIDSKITDDSIEQKKLYLEVRKSYEKEKYNSQNQFDKTILTISTVALGFSLTFIKNGNINDYGYIWLLIITWFLFLLSCSLILYSFWTSSKAFDIQIQLLDNLYEGKIPNNNNKYIIKTIRLSMYSGISLIIGILFLIIFLILNLL